MAPLVVHPGPALGPFGQCQDYGRVERDQSPCDAARLGGMSSLRSHFSRWFTSPAGFLSEDPDEAGQDDAHGCLEHVWELGEVHMDSTGGAAVSLPTATGTTGFAPIRLPLNMVG